MDYVDRTMSKLTILGWYKRIRVVKAVPIKKKKAKISIQLLKGDMEILER